MNEQATQKHILVAQDISAVGRISMMVALPILVSAGIQTSCLPTALLSTHPAEFEGFTFCDLTEEMHRILAHWKTLPMRFDAILTGYLGSPTQAQAILKSFEMAKENAALIVDPAMADHGKLYSKMDATMVEAMRTLCKKSTIFIPNLTEACLLAEQPYEDRHDDEGYIRKLSELLYQKVAKPFVLTGVSKQKGFYGAACFDGQTIDYFEKPKIEDYFYGTGDIFAAVLTASILRGKNIRQSTDIATEFTQKTIQMTKERNLPRRFGTCFEQNIPWLVQRLSE